MDDKRTIAWFSAFVIVVLLIGIASGILLDRFLIARQATGWGEAGLRGPACSSGCRRVA